MRSHRIARLVLAVGVCVGTVGTTRHTVADAATPTLVGATSSRAETVSVGAVYTWGPGHVTRISSVARSLGSDMYRVAYPTFSMSRLTRRSGNTETIIQRIPTGWFVPMGATVFPAEMVRTIAGDEAADILAAGKVLMDERSARMRGAEVGDLVYLRSSTRKDVPLEVGGIIRKWLSDSNDLLMSDTVARSLGLTDISRIVFVGGRDIRNALPKLASKGFVNGNSFRIRASWWPRNPDENIGIVSMKLELGEFYYRPRGTSAIDIQYAWRLNNIAWNKAYASIPLRASCHIKIVEAIQGALTEIKKAGLESHINVKDTNRYGGCYASRMSRLGNSFASVSRHSWAAALDINVSTNGQGVIPRMNCDVVRIFRKWGFAWGGNYTPFDGMHFEWVGEPRHKLGYPSMRCPNRVPVPETSTTTSTMTSTSTTLAPTTTASTTTSTVVAPTTTVGGTTTTSP